MFFSYFCLFYGIIFVNKLEGIGDMAKNTPQNIENQRYFTEQLNKIMKDKGIRQIDLHNELEIPKSTITGYVKGKSLPTDVNLQKISEFLGVKKSALDLRFENKKEIFATFESLKYNLSNNKNLVLNQLKNGIQFFLNSWKNDPVVAEIFYGVDIEKVKYLNKLYSRLVIFETENISNSELNDIIGYTNTEIWEIANENVIDSIANYIIKLLNTDTKSQNISLHTPLNIINLEEDKTEIVFNYLLNTIEESAKDNKRLLGYMLATKLGNVINDINQFLQNKEYKGMVISHKGAFIDPDVLIEGISYDDYREVQKKLYEAQVYVNEHLTDDLNS